MKSWVVITLGTVLLLAEEAQAAISGQIDARLIIIASCEVTHNTINTSGSPFSNFGLLDFGSTGSLFTTANGEVLTGGGGAVSILCSSGTLPRVKVGAGAHDAESVGGTRALTDGSNNFVPYDLYTDPGRTKILAIDGVIALEESTGVAQTVSIYGKALGKAGLPAGTYSDSIAIELTF